MSLSEIAFYCLRAGIFALAACVLYALYCHLRGREISKKRLLAVFYVAALIQITVLRGGVNWQDVLHGQRSLPRLIPLGTTIDLLHWNWWPFMYNVGGNLIWFVPLGMMLGRRSWLQALLYGALLSSCIELSQYLLMTGLTDIDDVILNALGSLIGWFIANRKRRYV